MLPNGEKMSNEEKDTGKVRGKVTETEPEPPKKRGLKRIPLRFLLPNIITLLAVCSGVTAIKLGFEGRFELAVGAIIFACVLDAADGRIARLLKGASKFGAELDSLADFVNFGVAPAILIYLWALHPYGNLGWLAALCLAICCALRLARFNVALEEENVPKWKMNYFVGIPAPAGALGALLPMYLGFLGIIDREIVSVFALPWVIGVSIGVISSLPTYSGKSLSVRVPRENALPIVSITVLFIVLLISFTWLVMLVLVMGYLAFLPHAYKSYKRLSKGES